MCCKCSKAGFGLFKLTRMDRLIKTYDGGVAVETTVWDLP